MIEVPEGYRLIKLDSVLVPKDQSFPKTYDAMLYLFDRYEQGMFKDKELISKLKHENNVLKDRLAAARRKLNDC